MAWLTLFLVLNVFAISHQQMSPKAEEGIAKASQECADNVMSKPYPNDGRLYCNATFDGWSCWDYTLAGTDASIPCPRYIDAFSPFSFATKHCTPEGRWYVVPYNGRKWSNYTECARIGLPVFDTIIIKSIQVTSYEVNEPFSFSYSLQLTENVDLKYVKINGYVITSETDEGLQVSKDGLITTVSYHTDNVTQPAPEDPRNNNHILILESKQGMRFTVIQTNEPTDLSLDHRVERYQISPRAIYEATTMVNFDIGVRYDDEERDTSILLHQEQSFYDKDFPAEGKDRTGDIVSYREVPRVSYDDGQKKITRLDMNFNLHIKDNSTYGVYRFGLQPCNLTSSGNTKVRVDFPVTIIEEFSNKIPAQIRQHSNHQQYNPDYKLAFAISHDYINDWYVTAFGNPADGSGPRLECSSELGEEHRKLTPIVTSYEGISSVTHIYRLPSSKLWQTYYLCHVAGENWDMRYIALKYRKIEWKSTKVNATDGKTAFLFMVTGMPRPKVSCYNNDDIIQGGRWDTFTAPPITKTDDMLVVIYTTGDGAGGEITVQDPSILKTITCYAIGYFEQSKMSPS